jgi:DNA polymerase
MIFIDFECRSECDLKERGVYNYARDPSTRVLCMAWAIDDGEVEVWTPGQPFPDVGDHMVYAHNAAFERLIWTYVLGPDHGVPVPALERFVCTAAQARANCAPGSLEDVGRFAGADMRKDHRGAALVRKCCIPPFKHTPQDLADLFDYCAQDVRAMRAFSKAMRPLSDEELRDYWINERINDRGVLVDVPLAQAAQRYAAAELKEIQHRVVELTAGRITSVRSPRMREWVLERLTPEQRALCVKDDKESIDKSVRANLLTLTDLDPDVREVIQAADDLWSSSVAKFGRMIDLADEDDHRVRGAFVFAGGAATGRAASYGLQLHNMVRKSAAAPDEIREQIVRGLPLNGKTNAVLKSMLRPSIIAPLGRVFINYDWSAIEARILPWLSERGEATLDIFRRGEDLYVANARLMFRVDEVTPDLRQAAKVAVLACGFGGGAGALQNMARAYGMKTDEREAKRLVDLWRRANPWAPAMWQKAEATYMRAMRNPGHEFTANRCVYMYDRTHLWYALPSGRVLCYPFARFDEDGGVSYAKAAWKPVTDAKEWPRARLYHAIVVENATQAAAHDVLRLSLRRLDAEGVEVIAHTHDEVLIECDEHDAERISELAKQIMCASPPWALDLPLSVDGSISRRYA